MSNVFFISDLHLGHRSILKHSPDHRLGCASIEQHDNLLITLWNQRVSKHDTVYLLGDVCWTVQDVPRLAELHGHKILVRGNHDHHTSARDWLQYVDDVQGVLMYKGHWLSHCPIHPAELWNKPCIHGHVHTQSIRTPAGDLDSRYVNVCVEALGGVPVSFTEILSGKYAEIRKC